MTTVIGKTFKGAAAQLTLLAGMSPSSPTDGGTFTAVGTVTGWPTANFVVAINKGLSDEEKIFIASRSGSTFTLGPDVHATTSRGYDNTAAATHTAGNTIDLVLDGRTMTDLVDHVENTGNDHHTQYLNTARHDIVVRHTFGGAFAAPVAPPDIATAGAAGTGTGPARSDHTHKLGAGAVNGSSLFGAGVVDANALAAKAVTLAKMNDLAASSFLGNNTGAPATPLALTPAQAKTLLAIASSDVSGLGTLATKSAVASADITDGTIVAADIADGTITAAKMASAFWAEFTAAQMTNLNARTTVTGTSGSPQSLPGTSQTVTISRAGQLVLIMPSVDVEYTGGSGGLQEAVTDVFVDGVAYGDQLIGKGQIASVLFRVSLGIGELLSGLSIGTHTIELKAWKLNAADTAVLNTGTALVTVRLG